MALLSIFAFFFGFICTLTNGETSSSLIASTRVLNLDGVPSTYLTFNGSFPGPLIRLSMNEDAKITVINLMGDRFLSVHWHGLFQKGVPFDDGVYGITECGILPNRGYTYTVSTKLNPGTYWYHSHVGMQLYDGLAGPLIVDDPKDPFRNAYDDDRLVFLSEKAYGTSDNFLNTFVPATAYAFSNLPRSVTVNGRGKCIRCVTECYTIFRVQAGKTYRFRLINGAARSPFRLYFSGLNVTVIEVDGAYTRPANYQSDFFYVDVGQRYSVLVRMPDEPGDFLLSIQMVGTPILDGYGTSYSIIRSTRNCLSHDEKSEAVFPRECGQSSVIPAISQSPPLNKRMQLTQQQAGLHMLRQISVPPPDQTLFYNISLNVVTQYFTVNNISFRLPYGLPLLKVLYDSNSLQEEKPPFTNQDDLPPGVDVFRAPQVLRATGTHVRIVINNAKPISFYHPIHLHGYKFSVIRIAKGMYATDSTDTLEASVPVPVQFMCDTLVVPGHSHAIVQVVADNPGVWAFHCHVLAHFDVFGLGAVFFVGNHSTIPIPQKSANWCS